MTNESNSAPGHRRFVASFCLCQTTSYNKKIYIYMYFFLYVHLSSESKECN